MHGAKAGKIAMVGMNRSPVYLTATASAAIGAAMSTAQSACIERSMIVAATASRSRQVASKVARLPRKIVDSVVAKIAADARATRSLNQDREIEYRKQDNP